LVKELLLSSNFWVLSKPIVKEFGLETAFILSNLAEAESILSDEEGWFYQTADTIEEITGLSNHKQTISIKQLIECGALEQKNKGVPMKRFFKINYETIQKLVFKNFENCSLKNSKTSIQKISKNKESINKELINKELNIHIKHEHLILTVEEYEKLTDKYGSIKVNEMIETIETYSKTYLKKYSSFNKLISSWLNKREKENKTYANTSKSKPKIATLEDMKGW